jgi:hypothetical protein
MLLYDIQREFVCRGYRMEIVTTSKGREIRMDLKSGKALTFFEEVFNFRGG